MSRDEEIARANIILDIKGDLQKTIGQVDRLGESTKKTSSGLSKVGNMFKSLATKAAVAVGAIGAIGYGLKKLITPASDFIESTNKLNVVFRDMGKEANAVLGKLRSEYKLSKLAATEYLSSLGDLMTGFGLTQKEALSLSDQMIRLSVDMSSFKNVPVEQAVNAISRALVGEREALKGVGITLKEAEVQERIGLERQRLVQEGFSGTRKELEDLARTHATFNLIVEDSTNSMGDFNRSLGSSLANQLRVAKARISDLVVEIGTRLLPAALKITETINNLLSTEADKQVSSVETSIARLLKARERGDEKAVQFYTNSLKNKRKRIQKEVSGFTFQRGTGLRDLISATGVRKFILDQEKHLENTLNLIEQAQEAGDPDSKLPSLLSRKKGAEEKIERARKALEEYEKQANLLKRIDSQLSPSTVPSGEGVQSSGSSPDTGAVQNTDKKVADNILTIMREAGKTKQEIRREELASYADYVTSLKEMDSRYVVLLSDNDKEIRANADSILSTITGLIKDIDQEVNKTGLEKFAEKFGDTFNQIADMVGNSLGTIGDVFNAFYEAQIDSIERRYAVERALLQAKTEEELALQEFNREREEEEFEQRYNMRQQEFLDMDNERQEDFIKKQGLDDQEKLRLLESVKSREEADNKIAKLEADKEKRVQAIKSRQFNLNKSASVGQIIIDTAKSVVGFLANPGGLLGLGLSATAGIIGSTQLGIAIGQPNPYRSYRWGGLVGEGGAMAKGETFFRAGEGTGPEAVLPASLTSFLMQAAKKWEQTPEITENTNNEIIVHIHNPINAEEVVEAIREQTGRRLL